MSESSGQPRTFLCKYERPCATCGTLMRKDTPITWQRGKHARKGTAWHSTCPSPSGRTQDGATQQDAQQENQESATESVQATPQVTATAPASSNADAAAVLANMLAPHMRDALNSKADAKEIEARIAELTAVIDAKLGEIEKRTPRAVTITVNDAVTGEVKFAGLNHKDTELLISLLKAGISVYLVGPPGSGKSTAAIRAAEILGRKWGYLSLNPRTAPSRIDGFMGADARTYHGTPFRDLYENGGVFVIDEMDNSGADLLTSLNGALENGHCAFPDGIVKRHADFIVVATGNTNGRGGNASFMRNALDAATLDRFFFLAWEYDEALERAIAREINPACDGWVDWVLRARTYCKEHYPKLFVTPRASIQGAKLLGTIPVKDIAFGLVFKGVDADTMQRVLQNVPLPTVKVTA